MNALGWFVVLVTQLLTTKTVLISAQENPSPRICPDGYAHDTLIPKANIFTCKPGPATGKKVMCHNIRKFL